MDALWSIAKLFILPETVEKIHLYGKTGWQQVLLDAIGADQLPAEYGGQCRCNAHNGMINHETGEAMDQCVTVWPLPDDVMRRFQERRAARNQATSPMSPSPTAAAAASGVSPSSDTSNGSGRGSISASSSAATSFSSSSTGGRPSISSSSSSSNARERRDSEYDEA